MTTQTTPGTKPLPFYEDAKSFCYQLGFEEDALTECLREKFERIYEKGKQDARI